MPTSPEHESISVALIYDDKEFGGRLREVLIESGVRVVCELRADRLEAGTKILAESGAEVVVVNLDPDLDEAIDQIMEMMDMDRQRLMINDAEASRSLDGWDQARWARHLAAKVLGYADVDPPRPAHAEPILVRVNEKKMTPVTSSSSQAEGVEEMGTGKTLPNPVTHHSNQESLALNARMGAEIESMLNKEGAVVSRAQEPERVPGSGASNELDQLLDELAGHVENLDVTALQEPTLQEPTLQEPTLQEPTLQEPTLQEPTLQEPTPQEPETLFPDLEIQPDNVVETSISTPQRTAEFVPNELDSWLAENFSDMPPVPEDESFPRDKSDDLIAPNRLSETDQSELDSPAADMDIALSEALQSTHTECLDPLSETSCLSGKDKSKDNVDSEFSVPDSLTTGSDYGLHPNREDADSSEALEGLSDVSAPSSDDENEHSDPASDEDSDIKWMLDELLEEPVTGHDRNKQSEVPVPSWNLVEDSQQAPGGTENSILPSSFSAVDDEGAVDYLNPGISDTSVSGFDGLELLPLEPVADVASPHGSQSGSESLVPRGIGVDRVIAIGASIGGPDALRTILAGLPANLAAVLVVAQHMDDAFFSNYIKQLKAVGTLPVQRAEDGGQAHHGEVLVVPPGQRLRLDRSGRIGLLPRADEDNYSPSIDDTFSTLATTFGTNLHVLILSGMARDALCGIQTVKKNGGVVWTQSPATCVVSSMVDAAQEAGLESFSSEPEILARRLVEEIGVESRK